MTHSKENYLGEAPMNPVENRLTNSQAFLLSMAQFQSTKLRQSRLLRRLLDEIQGESS